MRSEMNMSSLYLAIANRLLTNISAFWPQRIFCENLSSNINILKLSITKTKHFVFINLQKCQKIPIHYTFIGKKFNGFRKKLKNFLIQCSTFNQFFSFFFRKFHWHISNETHKLSNWEYLGPFYHVAIVKKF